MVFERALLSLSASPGLSTYAPTQDRGPFAKGAVPAHSFAAFRAEGKDQRQQQQTEHGRDHDGRTVAQTVARAFCLLEKAPNRFAHHDIGKLAAGLLRAAT